jgi:hypothetical protein
MSHLKASLFLVFCVLGVVLIGTSFSHFWRAHSLYTKEKHVILKPVTEDSRSLKIQTHRAEEPTQLPS